MANQDYLTIDSSQINMAAWDVALDRCTPWVRGGIPELSFSRLVGKLAVLPDSWSGKTCSWSNGASYPGTTYFTGTVVGYTDRFDHDFGWVRDYRALGLRNLADYVPVTDSNTFSDSAQFNMPSNTIQSIPARMGRTCGQAVIDILSMHQNATALSGLRHRQLCAWFNRWHCHNPDDGHGEHAGDLWHNQLAVIRFITRIWFLEWKSAFRCHCGCLLGWRIASKLCTDYIRWSNHWIHTD